MDITNGAVLGPYEIVAPIGAGGMGEVYRARDRRLDRHVALKVLPKRLAASAELRARFEREARAISAISHPHICSLFDVGAHEGTHYLVMELLDGETLADRILRGPMPIEQVLRYGTEIASALARAHHDGMIHRDLKPSNVMITKSGAKLLDFGLAKITRTAETVTPEATTHHVTDKALTAEGTMLGTYQYMAPEQVEGREADARSDIFAFGAVLYEMLTGRRAFEGSSRASVVAAVMTRDPEPIGSFQPLVPPALDRLIRTCLAKDPENRWQTMHDVMLQLRWIAEGGSQAGMPVAVVSRRRSRERIAWTAAALLAIALAATAILLYRATAKAAPPMRVTLPGRTAQFSAAGLRLVAPDGSFFLFQARDANNVTRLWKQGIGEAAATPIEGTEGARPMAIAPNGRSFVMMDRYKLLRVDLAGGAPVPLTGDVPEAFGVTWVNDATIVYAHERGLWRVGPMGGKPERLIQPPAPDVYYIWPEAIPGRDAFLFVEIQPAAARYAPRLHAFDLESRTSRVIGDATSRTLYRDGHLLSVRDGALVATPFDLDDGKTTGEPKVIAAGVEYYRARGDAQLTASASGIVAYHETDYDREVHWFDRTGRLAGEAVPAGPYYAQSTISPDGRQLAMAVLDVKVGMANIWIYGLTRPTRERLSFSDRFDSTPVWTPDQRWIIFSSDRSGVPDLFRRRADGTGSDELLYQAPGVQTAQDISPDGQWLIVRSSRVGTAGSDLLLLSLADRKAQTWLQTPANENWAVFSRDGRWIAYTSDETGKTEVYVRPFLRDGERVQISIGGGTMPKWSADGRELLYVSGAKVMSVDVTGGAFENATPRVLFTLPQWVSYWQLAPDGRFLVVTIPERAAARETHLVANWPALVR